MASDRAVTVAQDIARRIINEFAGAMLVPDGYDREAFYGRRMADACQPIIDAALDEVRREQREADVAKALDKSNLSMVGGSTGDAPGTAQRIAAAIRESVVE